MSPLNPYQPTTVSAAEPIRPKVLIAKPTYPAAVSGCRYFTFEEFSHLLNLRIVESCQTIGLDGIPEDQWKSSDRYDAVIRCHVEEILHWRMNFWQQVIRWLPIPIHYWYYPASFTVSGTIESPHHAVRPFVIHRTFDRGRLGEKANMEIGIGSEAMRIVSFAAKEQQNTMPIDSRGPFWIVVALVPLFVAVIATAGIYLGWDVVSGAIWSKRPPAQDRQIDVIVHSTLTFLGTWFFALAFLPAWIYSDPRAAFAYRFISARKSIVLRLFFCVPGLICMGLLIASLIVHHMQNW